MNLPDLFITVAFLVWYIIRQTDIKGIALLQTLSI